MLTKHGDLVTLPKSGVRSEGRTAIGIFREDQGYRTYRAPAREGQGLFYFYVEVVEREV